MKYTKLNVSESIRDISLRDQKRNQGENNSDYKTPPWHRYVLTITEAAEYYHIGEAKLRMLVLENQTQEFAILNGNRVLIKRKKFEEFLDFATAI
jgi:excisionase family DNA binding protein